MKKHTFLQNISFIEALALTLIAVSLATSNFYQLLATKSAYYHKQNQISAPEKL